MTKKIDPVIVRFYAGNAGWKGADLDTAVAVAWAESQLNAEAHNAKPPDDSYGLWQVNMLGALGPARRAQFKLSKNEDLFNPQTNAQVAYLIWKQAGWSAWTTYTSEEYKQYLGTSGHGKGVPSAQLGQTIPENAAGDAKDVTANGIAAAVREFSKNLGKDLETVGVILLAITVGVIGVLFLMHNSVSGVAKTAAKVVAL